MNDSTEMVLALVDKILALADDLRNEQRDHSETAARLVRGETGPGGVSYPQMSARIDELEQHIERLQKEAHDQQSDYDELLRNHNELRDALRIERRAREETQIEIDSAVTALRAVLGIPETRVNLPGTLMDLIHAAEQKVRERDNAYDRLLTLVGSTREPVGRPFLMSEMLDLVEGKVLRGGAP